MDVVFFPRNDYPNNVEICDHRLGKKMTYTENTDVLPLSAVQRILPMAVQRGIKTSVFASMEPDTVLNDYVWTNINNGLVWIDVYFMLTRNQATDHTEEEIEADYQRYLAWYLNTFNHIPIAIAYSIGNDSWKEYAKKYFIAGRNSGRQGGTDYGIGYGNPNNIPYALDTYISRDSTFRWFDTAVDNNDNFATQLQVVSDKIDETILNGGWINNFTHWHNVCKHDDDLGVTTGVDAYEDYFDMLQAKNTNNEIYFAGYGEAVAYLIYRQLVTKAVMYSPNANSSNQLIIRLEACNNVNVDNSLLQVPLSVKFSTIGTPLENENITSECNLVNLGNNEYIIEIPYAEYAGVLIEKVNT